MWFQVQSIFPDSSMVFLGQLQNPNISYLRQVHIWIGAHGHSTQLTACHALQGFSFNFPRSAPHSKWSTRKGTRVSANWGTESEAKLYFRYGAMSSSKTMNLLAIAHSYEMCPALHHRNEAKPPRTRKPPKTPLSITFWASLR